MSKKISQFRFKRFAVSHHRSAMKVGVDGVLIGCWTEIGASQRILDVGTGCGLIALIMAQRAPEAIIDAIDIDVSSIEEASENIYASPWKERVRAVLCSYSDVASIIGDDRYDVIVSNPPYFDSGLTETHTAREKARHQGELSPLSLLKGAKGLLNSCGSVAMVVPTDISGSLEEEALEIGFHLSRKCYFRGHKDAPYKRVMLQWELNSYDNPSTEADTKHLTLENASGLPTDDYRDLCKDFYLRF